MLDEIRESLVGIGLSPKESDVYLSMLQMGAASVQDIANKALVNRSTTYTTLESLKDRGLIRVFEREKGVVYAPEPPERLHSLLETQVQQLQSKKQMINGLLPKISTLFSQDSAKPRVRFYGAEELEEVLIQEFRCSHEAVWSLCVMDEALFRAFERCPSLWSDRHQAVGRLLFVKRFSASLMPRHAETRLQVRELVDAPLPSGELILAGSRCYFVHHAPQGTTIAIEHGPQAELIRGMYEMLWNMANVVHGF